MKALRKVTVLAAMAIMAVAAASLAQNWSPPVAVTTGAGDDHHVAVDYIGYGQTTIVWDRTDSSGTHLYCRTIDLVTGIMGPETRLTDGACTDQKPSLAPQGLYGMGIFFQSNRQGCEAIYFLENFTPAEPFCFLYSDVDLMDPQARYGGTCTPDPYLIICHSDSQIYACSFFWDLYLMHQSTYVPPSGDYPVYWADGGEIVYPPLYAYLCTMWESVPESQTEIEFSWQYAYLTPPLQGILENSIGLPRHRPQFRYDAIIFEQETAEGIDFYEAAWNYSTINFDPAQPLFEHEGTERNRAVCEGYESIYAFEQDWAGNWDIGFRAELQDITEMVGADSGEDCHPVIGYGYEWAPAAGYYVFWESNRDGSWKIYHSQRDIVAVEPETKMAFPEKFNVSVHPNPGNAEFKIRLDLPISGVVRAAVYDLSGRRVVQLHNGALAQGTQSLTWNAAGRPSGIYLLRVESLHSIQTAKIVLMK